MKKRVLLFVLPFLLLGCSRTETNQTEKEIIETNIRVKNEIVQYRDENGTWKDLTTVEILQNLTAEEPVTDSREEVIISTGTNGTDGKAGTDGKEGQRGLQGIQGRTGATGATGPRGSDGRNGKDGTQVTIAEDGELLLDGKGTGYILWKKPGETGGSYDECASYHRENNNGACGVCLSGYKENEFGACQYTGGIGKPIKLVINLERADWSVIKTQTETVIGGEEYSFSVPEELEGLHACYTKVTGTADIYSEDIDTLYVSVTYYKNMESCHYPVYTATPEPTPTPSPVQEATPTPSVTPTPTPRPVPTPTPTQEATPTPATPTPTPATPTPEQTQTCWDGSVIPVSQACPAQPTPTPMQTCWDGSVIPATDACPADTRVTCWDGSVALSESACPAQPQPENTPDNSGGDEDENG